MHYHEYNTELFYIISGSGILITPSGEKPVAAGDVIVCPPGEGGCHKIKNTSDMPLVYLDVDTANSPDIIRYPDSDKTGFIVHNGPCRFFKNGTEADYFDGE